MFAHLFLASLGLWILSILLSAFWKQAVWMKILVWVFLCTTLLLLGGMILEKFASNIIGWRDPWYLLLLLLPIGLWAVYLYIPDRFTKPLNYPLTDILPDSFSLTTLLARWAVPFSILLALVLCIIALARPVTISRSKLPPTQGIDIMMILDASASMNRNDFYPNRFVAAQKNAIQFIAKRFNDRIGLTLFAKNATLAAPLTLDHDALQELVASLYLGIVDPNLTAIGDALGVAANHLKNSTAKSKIILLLTDGSNNAGTLDPLLAAKAAAAYGIKVYTIATASPPGTSIFSSLDDEIDEGLLMNIAKETGGSFYRAKNEHELQEIYEQINELEKTDFTQSATISQNDAYRPLLILALCLLLAGVVLGKFIFIKVP
ncbi:MAG: VWA domain-containing protein [Elusimicrobiaceae bacterium]|nr:VWA domain-containing protein [Elusimicrobiaceae bacterium]